MNFLLYDSLDLKPLFISPLYVIGMQSDEFVVDFRFCTVYDPESAHDNFSLLSG